jgi:hypothetical protein
MRLIDADKFLLYLIFSKHIDVLTCGEIKEAVEMCKIDVFNKVRAEILNLNCTSYEIHLFKKDVLDIIDKYRNEVSE